MNLPYVHFLDGLQTPKDVGTVGDKVFYGKLHKDNRFKPVLDSHELEQQRIQKEGGKNDLDMNDGSFDEPDPEEGGAQETPQRVWITVDHGLLAREPQDNIQVNGIVGHYRNNNEYPDPSKQTKGSSPSRKKHKPIASPRRSARLNPRSTASPSQVQTAFQSLANNIPQGEHDLDDVMPPFLFGNQAQPQSALEEDNMASEDRDALFLADNKNTTKSWPKGLPTDVPSDVWGNDFPGDHLVRDP